MAVESEFQRRPVRGIQITIMSMNTVTTTSLVPRLPAKTADESVQISFHLHLHGHSFYSAKYVQTLPNTETCTSPHLS